MGSANKKPLLASIISQIIALSGTTILIGLKRFFMLMGKLYLPAYPGLSDIKIEVSSLSVNFKSARLTNFNYCLSAF